jgi:hypothetical protein
VEVGAAADDLVTAVLTAAALTVVFVDLLFAFVMLGSPEKPKGPERGPVAGLVDREVIGGGGIAGASRRYSTVMVPLTIELYRKLL